MTTKMFLKLYEIKKDISQIITIKDYLTFGEKDTLIRNVLKQTFEYRELGGMKSCSALRSKVFTESILSEYTNIEVDETTYDELAKANLLPVILRMIGNEYDMCAKMLSAYIDDIVNEFILLEDL